jgi:hypothetical protein
VNEDRTEHRALRFEVVRKRTLGGKNSSIGHVGKNGETRVYNDVSAFFTLS